jgi:hypothetical protein
VRTETVEVKVPVAVALPPELTAPIPHPAFPADPVSNKAKDDYLFELQNTLKRYKLRLDTIREVSTPKKD